MLDDNRAPKVKIFPKGTIIGDADKCYEIENNVNAGGEAIVYRAKAINSGRTVAVKLHYRIEDELELKRFLRVKHILKTVRGPNILPLEDAGVFMDGEERYPYFVFPFISGGKTLENVIEEHRRLMPAGKENIGTCVPFDDLLYFAISAGSGLRDAHSRGVQHRDFKPANVLIAGKGRNAVVRVMDFGIARFFDVVQDAKHTKLTEQGFFRGTPEYLSPEQAGGAGPDIKGDIWAFGVVLYEMITGASPFDFEDGHRMSVLAELVNKRLPPTPIEVYCAQVDPGLTELVMSCLKHEPDERPESMDEILEQLNRMELSLPHIAKSEPPSAMLYSKYDRSVDPEASTIAVPSTPPKPISIQTSVPKSMKITPSLSLDTRRIDDRSKKTAKSKNGEKKPNFIAYSLILAFILAGMIGFYFRQELLVYTHLQTVPLVKTAVSTQAKQSAAGLLTDDRSKFAKAIDSAKQNSLEEIAIVAEPDSSAKVVKPAESDRKKPAPKRNTHSEPIPGVDYIPGVEGL
jgi:serine/threonine protein kinase